MSKKEQSLRTVLEQLKPHETVKLQCKREDYLLTALSQQLEAQGKFPVIQMQDPDTGLLTVANLYGDRAIIGKHIHNVVNVTTKAEELKELEYVTDAPVQEVVEVGEQVDVNRLPAFRHFEGDAGRYITSGIVIARDPSTGRCNMSMHRIMLRDRDRMGISLHSRGDAWRYLQEAAAMGKDLEVAVVIGCHPAYYLTGTSKIPADQDDYSWAAAYMDERAQVVQAKTVDIPVPACAEYVLEGVISATEFEDEGPFGEFTGYSTSRSTRNVLKVTAVTHRRDPIYQDLVPGYAWEHLLLSQYTKEVILLQKLQQEIPGVKALAMPKDGCHFHAYLSMDVKAKGQAKQAAMLLFGLDLYLKLIIVVDENVDVYRESDVMWAVATHVQADRDVFIVPGVLCNRLDPSSVDGMSAKMCIDATGDPGEKLERVKVPGEADRQAAELLKKYGL